MLACSKFGVVGDISVYLSRVCVCVCARRCVMALLFYILVIPAVIRFDTLVESCRYCGRHRRGTCSGHRTMGEDVGDEFMA